MPNDSSGAPRALPDRPNLRHLRDQAKDLLKSGEASTLTAAQFQIARLYGFASWPKLQAHVESFEEAGQLEAAMERGDVARVKSMLVQNPDLHRAPIGYGKGGPLTWVAECTPSQPALPFAKWLIDNGSDVHQGGDAPLMRAALNRKRIPMMELLVAHGADVNAAFDGSYPIVFAPCETLEPDCLRWLLSHGADPNCGSQEAWKSRGVPHPGTALDYLLGAYVRDSSRLRNCIDIVLDAGGESKHAAPSVLAVIRGRLDELARLLDADQTLVNQRFAGLDFGTTAARMLTLRGTTLLHVAAEFQNLEAATLLLGRGADVNAPAELHDQGVGGQTPIFHAATQREDAGLPIVRLLVERGADLSVRAKLPGHYERPGEIVECTPLEYALLFPGDHGPASAFLRRVNGTMGKSKNDQRK
jgi:ankyrin repeat protein